MQEVFPITAGIVIGLLSWRYVAARWRLATLIVLSLVFGFIASAISGELAVSLGFIGLDTLFVFLAALGTLAVIVGWKARAARSSFQ